MKIRSHAWLGLGLLAACGDGSTLVPTARRLPLGLDAEVALLSASAAFCHDRCDSPALSAVVRVKNLAYDKQVALFVRDPAGGPWTELGGWFQQQLGTDYELWSVADFITWQGDYEFAVQYTAAGTTYWDNNGGGNYLLHVTKLSAADNTGGLAPAPVQLTSLTASVATAGKIAGTVVLQNLAYDKSVNAVYTTDHWTTTQTAAATYGSGPTLDGAETWSFTIDAPATPGSVELAVSYTAAGATYWDSFFGRNYIVDVR